MHLRRSNGATLPLATLAAAKVGRLAGHHSGRLLHDLLALGQDERDVARI